MRDSRSLNQEAQESIRTKAVNALIGGQTQEQVAKIFGVTRQAVGKWWAVYKKGGMNAFPEANSNELLLRER